MSALLLILLAVVVEESVAVPSRMLMEGLLARSGRTRREIDSNLIDISFTLDEYKYPDHVSCPDNFSCLGGSDGLCSTAVQLEYRNDSDAEWKTRMKMNISSTPGGEEMNHTLPFRGCVEFRFVQWEHGGGCCNCWRVSNILVNYTSVSEPAIECNGSASRHRVSMIFTYPNGCSGNQMNDSRLQETFDTSCSNTTPRIELSFQFPPGSECNEINGFNEGVELSFRSSTGSVWVPLSFYYRSGSNDASRATIPLGEVGESLNIRGYLVEDIEQINDTNTNFTVDICHFAEEEVSKVQFRWLQTSQLTAGSRPKDVWSLDNLTISYITSNGERVTLLHDPFDNEQLNDTLWPQRNLRNGNISSQCADGALVFGLNTRSLPMQRKIITSRSVLTIPLSLPSPPPSSTPLPPSSPSTLPLTTTDMTTTSTPLPPSSPSSTSPLTTDMTTASTPLPPSSTSPLTTTDMTTGDSPADLLVKQAEERAREKILNDTDLRPIFMTSFKEPGKAIKMFQGVLENQKRSEPVVFIYLLGSILNRTEPTDMKLSRNVSLDVASRIIMKSESNTLSMLNNNVANVEGSSIFNILDRFIFNQFQQNMTLSKEDIILHRKSISQIEAREDSVMAVDSAEFSAYQSPRMSIEFPNQLINEFLDSNGDEVTLGSFVYSNVTGLFPERLPGMNITNITKFELGSGIVSTTLRCGDQRCDTKDLDTLVTIRIEHSREVKERISNDSEYEVLCVFLKFLSGNDPQDDTILSAGEWSDRGCKKNENLSNSSMTVCECNHLTHFAILLSARPLNAPPAVLLSLEIIGYVGVSVSLVAMAVTVIIFIVFRSLHSMRNFIHINLCISLGIAQLIFVIGVTRVGDKNDPVPIHCQVIAVLLHYFFLVSFMWMLMEGVVLYVALVLVFVKHKKRYMCAFTIISYGVPLLYMALTIALGFVLPTQPNYGYTKACFLNPGTHFIWAFIVPVVMIILINCGFFIMAVTIMWRHQKKQTGGKSNLKTIKGWLKGTVSLVVIMGLTWIVGILIVEVKALLPLAYIYTIMVAFQGLFIFLIFVVFSKQVREAYTKWWKIKVNESEFLGKHFGEKKITSSTAITGVRYAPSLLKQQKALIESVKDNRDNDADRLSLSEVKIADDMKPMENGLKVVETSRLEERKTTIVVNGTGRMDTAHDKDESMCQLVNSTGEVSYDQSLTLL